jgi:hypothetical protein
MKGMVIRPCKTKAGFEAVPPGYGGATTRRLNLEDVAETLKNQGFKISKAGILLITAREDLPEITVYPTGRLIIKTDSEKVAKRSASSIYEVIGLE